MKDFFWQHSGYLLVAAALLIGLCTYGNYGVAWDEDDQHALGKLTYEYVVNGNDLLQKSLLKEYGSGYEWLVYSIQKNIGLTDSRDLYRSRHLMNHLFFLAGVLLAWLLIRRMYGDSRLALAAASMILLAPLLYAHSFFNSKDIPFLVVYLASLNALHLVFLKGSWWRYLVLGVSLGLLINLRILGLLPFGLALLLLMIDSFRKNAPGPGRHRGQLLGILLLIGTTAVVTIGSWPYLWPDPIGNFTATVQKMAHFPWEGTMTFQGREVRSKDIPWNYLPVWFGITTPIPFLALGILGIAAFFRQIFQRPLLAITDLNVRMNFIFLMTIIAPISAALLLGSVLLDGWRHMYFTYPAFVFMGIFGISVLSAVRLRQAAYGLLLAGIVTSGWFMVKNAPFQHLYFNVFVNRGEPDKIRKSYEMDYWGTGYKQALEYILEKDKAQVIKIAVENYPGKANVGILKASDRARITIVEKKECEYFITNYRWHPQEYSEIPLQFKWHSLEVDNNAFITIFRFKQ